MKQIKKDLPISCKRSTVEEAKSERAIGLFECKYGDQVKVYTRREICGGPHADHTGEISASKILKEEAIVRRIKVVIGKWCRNEKSSLLVSLFLCFLLCFS